MAKQTAKSQNTNSTNGAAVPQQIVSFGEYNGNRMFYVRNGENDRFPTQLGARKVRDVIGNIQKALEFLGQSDDQRDKDTLAKFNKVFKAK